MIHTVKGFHIVQKTEIDVFLEFSCFIDDPADVGYQATWPASWEICMQVRKQWLEMDMEQWTSSKEEKEYVKAVYCHPVYLTYMQSTSWEMLDWKKQAGIKIAKRNINNLRYADDTTLMAESEEKLKSLLIKVKVESEKLA